MYIFTFIHTYVIICVYRQDIWYVYIYVYIYMYIYIWARSPDPHTPPLPPQWYPPPLLTPPPPPPPPQNLVFACYLHIYIHIYTYKYCPFHPSNLASLRYLQHLRATTSSTDLVYLYISIITFFRTAYSVPRTWFTTYLLPMDYAKLTYANLDICAVEKQ